jgi:hypothetical protein
MMPLEISEANMTLLLPNDLLGHKTKARCVRARIISVTDGPLDGLSIVIIAYKPSPLDISRILSGEPIYLSFMAGVAPHFLSTALEEALNPS